MGDVRESKRVESRGGVGHVVWACCVGGVVCCIRVDSGGGVG